MAIKRALVVDDSKSARVALQKQLQVHNLSVETADSGEDALDFLTSHMVDVIFMDHEMPGMDGFEAVRAIKSNPRTAMIPVMMYTSRGGELYISQARALGAVDLLPKQTEPGVLFNMLLKLGLVTERRTDLSATDGDGATREQDGADTPDVERDEKPIGIELSGLLTRMLEDQYLELRSELKSGFGYFARQVASDIHDRQKAEQEAAQKAEQEAEQEAPPPEPATSAVWPLLTGALAIALAVALLSSTWLFLQVRTEREAASENVNLLTTSATRERQTSMARQEQLASNITEERTRSELAIRELLDALAWSINQASTVPYGQPHLNDATAYQLTELLWQLSNADFNGTVRVEAHLGEFCLVSDITGAYRLADPDAPLATCAFVGHPLDNSNLLSDRQTLGFERFLAESPLIKGSGIELEVIARQRVDSVPRVPYPARAGYSRRMESRRRREQSRGSLVARF